MPLPNGVPALPPGRFYRVRPNGAFPAHMINVQIRERRRFGSREVSEVILFLADFDTAESAVAHGFRTAKERADAIDRARGVSAAIHGFFGDHEAGDA